MKLSDLEHATIKTPQHRSVPKWVLDAIERERSELQSITDPYKRRLAEIELDLRLDRIRFDIKEQ